MNNKKMISNKFKIVSIVVMVSIGLFLISLLASQYVFSDTEDYIVKYQIQETGLNKNLENVKINCYLDSGSTVRLYLKYQMKSSNNFKIKLISSLYQSDSLIDVSEIRNDEMGYLIAFSGELDMFVRNVNSTGNYTFVINRNVSGSCSSFLGEYILSYE